MSGFKGLLGGMGLTVLLAIAVPAAGPAEQAGDMHHAAKALARDIKAKRHAQGMADGDKPTKALGSSKTVRFKLLMNQGKGSDEARAYCFGYILHCKATVIGPKNTYSGQVSTSEGSQVKFDKHRAGQPLDMTLHTSFFGDTAFGLVMEATERPWPVEAVVELVCSY